MQRRLDLILRGGAVKRYHVMDTLRTQNVAEHSFGVAWLCWLLCNGKPSVQLVMAALQHDLAEHVTGDLPAPAKRALNISEQFAAYEVSVLEEAGMLITLTQSEKRTLKFADTCELLLFCLQEMSLGNRSMSTVYSRGLSYIMEMAPISMSENALYTIIEEKFNEIYSE